MRNFLITGGTDGIGRGIALDALEKGDRVIAVGHTAARGAALLAAAEETGAADRAEFIQADLRLIAENARVADLTRSRFGHLDRLVLCAQRYQTKIRRTADGLEENFALSCLSRFLLADRLRPALALAPAPLVVNVCGTATAAGQINWDDVQFSAGRGGFRALMQAARATDLLGPLFAKEGAGIPYVLFNPDVVRTNLQRELGLPWRLIASITLALHGKTVAEGIRPLVRIVDAPPAEPLTAFRGEQQIDVHTGKFARYYDDADASRLGALIEKLLPTS
jgi:NAD(P)-dependent dehydrogenase (short-subunit alcohol dehydrogenase family)